MYAYPPSPLSSNSNPHHTSTAPGCRAHEAHSCRCAVSIPVRHLRHWRIHSPLRSHVLAYYPPTPYTHSLSLVFFFLGGGAVVGRRPRTHKARKYSTRSSPSPSSTTRCVLRAACCVLRAVDGCSGWPQMRAVTVLCCDCVCAATWLCTDRDAVADVRSALSFCVGVHSSGLLDYISRAATSGRWDGRTTCTAPPRSASGTPSPTPSKTSSRVGCRPTTRRPPPPPPPQRQRTKPRAGTTANRSERRHQVCPERCTAQHKQTQPTDTTLAP